MQVCIVESVLDKSYVVGHVMVLYSPNWTNIGFSFILLTIICFVTILLSSTDYSFKDAFYLSYKQVGTVGKA